MVYRIVNKSKGGNIMGDEAPSKSTREGKGKGATGGTLQTIDFF
jgi:hypothetical protein